MLQKATPLIRFKMAISNGRFSMPNNKEETGETEELKIRKSGQGRGVGGFKIQNKHKKKGRRFGKITSTVSVLVFQGQNCN